MRKGKELQEYSLKLNFKYSSDFQFNWLEEKSYEYYFFDPNSAWWFARVFCPSSLICFYDKKFSSAFYHKRYLGNWNILKVYGILGI